MISNDEKRTNINANNKTNFVEGILRCTDIKLKRKSFASSVSSLLNKEDKSWDKSPLKEKIIIPRINLNKFVIILYIATDGTRYFFIIFEERLLS